MEKVTVNRGVLGGLVAVAAGSLLAVAFLLGRASGRNDAPAPAAGAVAPDAAARSLGPLSDPGPALAPAARAEAPPPALLSEPPLAPSEPGALAPAVPATAQVPPPPIRAGAAADPERAAVAAYFEAVDRIQPARVGGTAESAANELATALARGDTSGLDGMIRDAEAAKASLAAVVPPAVCAAHYRESAASLDDGLEMLRALKASIESPDPVASLAGVAARATGLRARAEALQREDSALRERYGLAR